MRCASVSEASVRLAHEATADGAVDGARVGEGRGVAVGLAGEVGASDEDAVAESDADGMADVGGPVGDGVAVGVELSQAAMSRTAATKARQRALLARRAGLIDSLLLARDSRRSGGTPCDARGAPT